MFLLEHAGACVIGTIPFDLAKEDADPPLGNSPWTRLFAVRRSAPTLIKTFAARRSADPP